MRFKVIAHRLNNLLRMTHDSFQYHNLVMERFSVNHSENETVETAPPSVLTNTHLNTSSRLLFRYDSVIEVVCHYSDFLMSKAHSL